MMFESWLGRCPFCDQYYRGLLHRCPYCGYELRPAPKISDEKWELVQKQIKKSEIKFFSDDIINENTIGIDPASGEDCSFEVGVIKDGDNFKITEISLVPKHKD